MMNAPCFNGGEGGGVPSSSIHIVWFSFTASTCTRAVKKREGLGTLVLWMTSRRHEADTGPQKMLMEHASPYEFRRISEYADGTNMQICMSSWGWTSTQMGLILLETNTQISMSSEKLTPKLHVFWDIFEFSTFGTFHVHVDTLWLQAMQVCCERREREWKEKEGRKV